MMQMMQMQPGAAPAPRAPAAAGPSAQMPEAAPQETRVMAARAGGPLQVSKGMDPAVVSSKIREIAVSIIGDDEDVDVDTPLMQAGLTSNTAVMLRDELSKDIPGVNLPPTLMFDYPSISAISEFILTQ